METEATLGREKSRSAGQGRRAETEGKGIRKEQGPLTPPVIFRATLREYKAEDHEKLVALYAAFEPKGAYQGLPPHSEALVRKWLDRLQESGSIFFVVEVEGCIAGHSMLCPADHNTAELAIFLHQDYRGLGLGKRLLLGTLNYACKRLQLAKVWLSVQGANIPALTLFKKTGFRPIGREDFWRWEVELQRPLSCEPCLEDHCAIFGTSLPFTHEVRTRRN